MTSIDAGANAGRAAVLNALFLTTALIAPSTGLSSPASAQTTKPAATELPAVEITAPQASRRQAQAPRASNRPATGPSRRSAQRTARAPQPAQPSQRAVFERGTDPVPGFVPSVSASGTKTDTKLIETPQSISVVSRDNLDARGVDTIAQALQYSAGVAVQTGGADPRYDQARIRGFETNGFSNYRDGLRDIGNGSAYFSVFRNEPYGVQRVDIVKGPSSVMYGQSPPGGLIDLISKRPTEQAFGEVVGLVGSADRLQGAFDVGGPLDKDKSLFYRLTGVLRDSDAQIAKFSDKVKDDRAYIAPAITWRPTNDTTLTILSDYQHDVTGNAFPLSVATVRGGKVVKMSALPLFLGDPSYNTFDQTQYRIGYQFEHRFSDDLIVRSRARYGHVDLEYRYLTFAGTPLDTQTMYPRVSRRVFETSDSFNTDNHLIAKTWTGDLQHTVLAGMDYQAFELSNKQYNGAAPSLSRINPVYGQAVAMPTTLAQSFNQTLNQAGLYLQDQIKWQNWLLTLGGRFDQAQQDTLNRITGQPQISNDTSFTKRAGLTYLFDSGVAPYVSYSESFMPTAGTQFTGEAFRPTTGKQVEGGLKFQPNRDLLFTAAAFDLTQNNVLTADPNNLNYSIQTGQVNSRGFEFEVLAKPVAGLNVVASYTVLDMKITESNNGDVGKVPLQQPRNMASAFADYTLQSGPLAGWGLGAGVRYVGESYMDAANTLTNDAYTVFDAGLHYRQPKGMNFALNVKNIANKDNLLCTVTGGCQYITPRVITATASYRW
ncbi:TonB-dependent siderophore receptor [Rhodopseudomonas palustris]|uniref:TonB-dependent siderophore receptor n=1 Tax=Rhodopseudomonas palustris TaxID=1076 RepID=A0A418VE01_RHOPL|nr:TonB-dependent siderophore receptor [Rhodopseudomonas palustris]RJF74327.1 TonB-dependent siderophore receptor [Rhodopseudomonas palustris]